MIYFFHRNNIRIHNFTQTRSRSLPHATDTKLTVIHHCSLSAGVFQWSALKLVYLILFHLHYESWKSFIYIFNFN